MNTAEKVYHDVLLFPESLAQEVLQFVEDLRRKNPSLNAKADFKQEALDSRLAYQNTGLHLTGNEVQNWLNTWGTEEEKDAPKCHK